MTLRVEVLTGDLLQQHLEDLARLRIEVFRAYPYLYVGDVAYERRYLAAFAGSPDAAIIGAFDDDVVVGAASCAPLKWQMREITAPFAARGWNLKRYFYFGESVLKSYYRGQGIGVRFFEMREDQARACGAEVAAFCSVVRPRDHRMRPSVYVPLDPFWLKRGYAPVADLLCELSWKEIGAQEESAKPMQFWAKRLMP